MCLMAPSQICTLCVHTSAVRVKVVQRVWGTFSANYLLQIISRWDMRYFVAPILTRPNTIFASMFEGVIWGVGELLLTSMFALYLIGDQYSCGNKLSVSNI